MPATASNDPLEVLAAIRDIVADIYGLAQQQSVNRGHDEAAAELRRADGNGNGDGGGASADGAADQKTAPHPQPQTPRGNPHKPAILGELLPEDRSERQEYNPHKATMKLLGSAGGAFAEVAGILGRLKAMGEALGELFPGLSGLLGGGSQKQQPTAGAATGEKSPAADLPPALPEGAFRTSPGQHYPTRTGGVPQAPNPQPAPATPQDRSPIPDLPAPLAPTDRPTLPTPQAIPELPAPLEPTDRPTLPTPQAIPELPAPLEPTEHPDLPTPLEPGEERRERSAQGEWREARSLPMPLPMPVPQPGQGTTPLASGREDADVVVGQTTPMLSPGPTPATGDAQGQQDQARLSMALEKLVALLQRDAGGDGNDRDNDETESGENYSPSSMWREEPSGGGGQGHERHAASSLPAGLQQFGTQKEARDPLQPGQGATDKKGGVIGWLRGWLGV